jgi:hypothetical protein
MNLNRNRVVVGKGGRSVCGGEVKQAKKSWDPEMRQKWSMKEGLRSYVERGWKVKQEDWKVLIAPNNTEIPKTLGGAVNVSDGVEARAEDRVRKYSQHRMVSYK